MIQKSSEQSGSVPQLNNLNFLSHLEYYIPSTADERNFSKQWLACLSRLSELSDSCSVTVIGGTTRPHHKCSSTDHKSIPQQQDQSPRCSFWRFAVLMFLKSFWGLLFLITGKLTLPSTLCFALFCTAVLIFIYFISTIAFKCCTKLHYRKAEIASISVWHQGHTFRSHLDSQKQYWRCIRQLPTPLTGWREATSSRGISTG